MKSELPLLCVLRAFVGYYPINLYVLRANNFIPLCELRVFVPRYAGH